MNAAHLHLMLIGATALAAAIGLWQSIKKTVTSRPMLFVIIGFNLIALGAISRTAYWGGKVSHPEIRDSVNQITSQSGDHD